MDKFIEYKDLIDKYLNDFFDKLLSNKNPVNQWEIDTLKRLKDFNSGGKKIRGSLVLLAYEMLGNTINDNVIKLGSAIELASSSLLIHDDILDDDRVRRGNDSIFFQYQKMAIKKGLNNPGRFGYGMGIVNGDYGFFLSYLLLAKLKINQNTFSAVVDEFSAELQHVSLGEMEDYYLDSNISTPTKAEILKCYQDKTANYSFCWPLRIGYILGGIEKNKLDNITRLGELLGLIYQIKDDELGMFGNEKQTGKPVGSDVSEGKKTLYYYFLHQKVSSREWTKLNSIFGNKLLKENDLDFVKIMIKKFQIPKEIGNILDIYSAKSIDTIQNLAIDKKFKKTLINLLEFIITRSN
jgi:geranylgeranyl diphosphate synthase, type I